MKIYDTHTHTDNSTDCKQSIYSLCKSAKEKGVSGIAVTDHADIFTYKESDTYNRICKSVKNIESAQKEYFGTLEIFKGIEIGDMYISTVFSEEVKKISDFDVILGSIHFVRYKDIQNYYSAVSFDEKMPMEKINGFLKEYFALVKNMIDTNDFDILTHLTCPLRYIRGKYDRNVDLDLFLTQIREILKAVIKKDVALEVNVSVFSGKNNPKSFIMPDIQILKLYREYGGNKITIGSDAHIPSNVANRFDEVAEILKSLGFESYCYFKNRIAKYINFE